MTKPICAALMRGSGAGAAEGVEAEIAEGAPARRGAAGGHPSATGASSSTWPHASMRPARAPTGASSGLSERRSVVLPQPVGPVITQNAPSLTASDTSRSTGRGEPSGSS